MVKKYVNIENLYGFYMFTIFLATWDGILPEYPQSASINTLCDITIDNLDIIKAIRQMNRNSAPGPDGVHPKFITKIYTYLIKPLKRIFNVSLSTGTVPDSWKIMN